MLYQHCSFSASVGALLNNISAGSKCKDGGRGRGSVVSAQVQRLCPEGSGEGVYSELPKGPRKQQKRFQKYPWLLDPRGHCASHFRDPETSFLFSWGKCPRVQLLDLTEVSCSFHLEGPSLQELTWCSVGRRRTSAQAEGSLHPWPQGFSGSCFLIHSATVCLLIEHLIHLYLK